RRWWWPPTSPAWCARSDELGSGRSVRGPEGVDADQPHPGSGPVGRQPVLPVPGHRSVAVEHRGGTGTCTVGAAPALVRAQLQVGEQVRYVQRRIAEGGEVE